MQETSSLSPQLRPEESASVELPVFAAGEPATASESVDLEGAGASSLAATTHAAIAVETVSALVRADEEVVSESVELGSAFAEELVVEEFEVSADVVELSSAAQPIFELSASVEPAQEIIELSSTVEFEQEEVTQEVVELLAAETAQERSPVADSFLQDHFAPDAFRVESTSKATLLVGEATETELETLTELALKTELASSVEESLFETAEIESIELTSAADQESSYVVDSLLQDHFAPPTSEATKFVGDAIESEIETLTEMALEAKLETIELTTASESLASESEVLIDLANSEPDFEAAESLEAASVTSEATESLDLPFVAMSHEPQTESELISEFIQFSTDRSVPMMDSTKDSHSNEIETQLASEATENANLEQASQDWKPDAEAEVTETLPSEATLESAPESEITTLEAASSTPVAFISEPFMISTLDIRDAQQSSDEIDLDEDFETLDEEEEEESEDGEVDAIDMSKLRAQMNSASNEESEDSSDDSDESTEETHEESEEVLMSEADLAASLEAAADAEEASDEELGVELSAEAHASEELATELTSEEAEALALELAETVTLELISDTDAPSEEVAAILAEAALTEDALLEAGVEDQDPVQVEDELARIATSIQENDRQHEETLQALAPDTEAEAAKLLAEQIAEDEALARAEQAQLDGAEDEEEIDPELLAALPKQPLTDEHGNLDLAELESCIEALLFMTDKPMSLTKLQDLLGPDFSHSLFQEAMTSLRDRYSRPFHGIELVEVAGGIQFRTKPGRAALAKKLAKVQTQRLSSGAMETLAIVAYKQPVLKEEIDKVRGVDSSHFVRGLIDKKLVKISGRSDLPGRPMLYSTSGDFLELFGLKNLAALPSLRELEQMVPGSQSKNPEDEDPRVKEMRRLVGEMKSDTSTTLLYDPKEDEKFLKDIRERVNSISTTSPYIEAQKLAEKSAVEAAKLAAAGGAPAPKVVVPGLEGMATMTAESAVEGMAALEAMSLEDITSHGDMTSLKGMTAESAVEGMIAMPADLISVGSELNGSTPSLS